LKINPSTLTVCRERNKVLLVVQAQNREPIFIAISLARARKLSREIPFHMDGIRAPQKRGK